jgi:hypothetical protein
LHLQQLVHGIAANFTKPTIRGGIEMTNYKYRSPKFLGVDTFCNTQRVF